MSALNSKITIWLFFIIPLILAASGIIFLLYTNFFIPFREQQFIFLAKSFLAGKLYFTQIPGSTLDTALYKNHYFWPLGPFPAILLMPFVFIFGLGFHQGYIQFFLNILNLFLLFKIAKKITYNTRTSLWLSFGYVFSTSYLPLALVSWSSWFAQILATSLLLLALNEYFSKKRWFLIGIFVGCALATRLDLIFSLVFFVFSAIYSKDLLKTKIKTMINLFAPIILTLILLLIYNQARFDNPFEQGYNLQILNTKLAPELATNRNQGLWSFIHFPANLYYLFLKGPEGVFIPGTKILTAPFIKADIWGMSIFFTAPLFLWIIKAPFKESLVRLCLLAAAVLLFFILGYYGIGITQFGYRYALDFYPFLFIVLSLAIKKQLPSLFKLIIIASFFFNIYFL